MAYNGKQPKVERVNLEQQTSAPSNPLVGDLYYQDDTSTLEGGLKIYKDSAYVPVSFGRENFIINGNFDYWQRGVTIAATSRRFCDRIYSTSAFGGTATVSRQSFTQGAHELGAVKNPPRYFMRFTQGSVAINLITNVENVRQTAGKSFVLTFWAKTSSDHTLGLGLYQNFGTGGSPSSDVAVGISTLYGSLSLTSSWQKISLKFTCPAIDTKTVGTNENSSLQIFFYTNTGTGSRTTDIAQVMMNEGTIAADFNYHGGSIESDLVACEYYFKKSHNVNTAPASASGQGVEMGTGTNTTSNLIQAIHHGRKMRTTPTITLYDDGGTPGEYFERTAAGGLTDSITAFSTFVNTHSTFTIASTSGNSRAGFGFAYTLEAEY